MLKQKEINEQFINSADFGVKREIELIRNKLQNRPLDEETKTRLENRLTELYQLEKEIEANNFVFNKLTDKKKRKLNRLLNELYQAQDNYIIDVYIRNKSGIPTTKRVIKNIKKQLKDYINKL